MFKSISDIEHTGSKYWSLLTTEVILLIKVSAAVQGKYYSYSQYFHAGLTRSSSSHIMSVWKFKCPLCRLLVITLQEYHLWIWLLILETLANSNVKYTSFFCHNSTDKRSCSKHLKVINSDCYQITYLPSSSPKPRSKMRLPPSSSSLLSTYFPIAL